MSSARQLQETVEPDPEIVGREAECAVLNSFVGAARVSGAFILLGGAGIGKTTLWEAGAALARQRGVRVLLTRASEAEARLAFAALIDLLDRVDTAGLGLPDPQHRALDVALLRAEPVGAWPEEQAIALGFLNALRALAEREPLLVAIDDVQWLDRPSAMALAFAARRLDRERVGFLLARRPGAASPLERELGRQRLQRLELAPLSLGATQRLLAERLGLSLPRHVLRRLHETTLGNPLFSLELGRGLVEHGSLDAGDEMPVPDGIEDLLGTRIAGLPTAMRRLLLAVALSADLRTAELAEIEGESTLADVLDRRLLLVDNDRVRPSHPLLAAAARRHSRVTERRELHRKLATVVADEEVRARHLALATEHPDESLAATVAAAAASAASRGARQDAIELAEHGLRLTPHDSEKRTERLLFLADQLAQAGSDRDKQRITDLLEPEVEQLPTAARVRAYVLLAEGRVQNNDQIQRYLERALTESGRDPVLRAPVLVEMAENMAVIRVERISEAEAWAREAVHITGQETANLYVLAWSLALQGRAMEDLPGQDPAVSRLAISTERVAAQRLLWRGEVARAREPLTRMLALADERGEAYGYALCRLHLCQLMLRVGDLDGAQSLLEEWASDRDVFIWSMYERCRALLAAGRGDAGEADRWAAETIARSQVTGNRWDELEALRARGTAALLSHHPESAAATLRSVWAHTLREGVDELGVFPVAPDLVEALVELGEADEAQMVTARLRELSVLQDHPWGLVTSRRRAALIRLAAHDEGAAADLADAAVAYGALGLQFDRARALFALGRSLRRLRKWRAARTSLEEAVAAFDELGAVGWAEAARSELARVGGRRASTPGELTSAERRVVELAVDGMSNKEIARALVVTVPTVQTHLSRAYAKLGVRSRAQLAGRLSADR